MVSTAHTGGYIGELHHSQKSNETKCSAQPKAQHENKRAGATQEEAQKLSGMRLILVRVLYLAMESYWMMSGV